MEGAGCSPFQHGFASAWVASDDHYDGETATRLEGIGGNGFSWCEPVELPQWANLSQQCVRLRL